MLKECDFAFVTGFYDSAKLSKTIMKYFRTLVPKSQNRQEVVEVRPICLIGSLYMILFKLLAVRLEKVVGSLVSSCQSNFIPKRHMLDGVVAIDKVMDFA